MIKFVCILIIVNGIFYFFIANPELVTSEESASLSGENGTP